MKRSQVRLEDVADWDNLTRAAHRAATGKRFRSDVVSFFERLDDNLTRLRADILAGVVEVGRAVRFSIRDPKPRRIHAPCFRERVLHHALMNHVGPVLERALIDDTFACRVGRGTLAAVSRAQQHVRRFEWYAKLDIRQYFASIDHARLLSRLERQFRSAELLDLMRRIVVAHEDGPGRGLPIGALTSQCWANFYLGPLDRYLLEVQRVSGLVRYMDDFVFWMPTRPQVIAVVESAERYVGDSLRLTIKQPIEINRSRFGLTLCGFRIRPGTVLLGPTRRRRYRRARAAWERAYLEGRIDARQLQRGYDAAHAITLHADASGWRRGLAVQQASWYDDV